MMPAENTDTGSEALFRMGFEVLSCYAMALIFVIRALAIKYHLGVPVFTGKDSVFHHHHERGKPGSPHRS